MPRPVHWPNPIILPDGLDDTGAPDALVCPITQELMREPALVTTSGRTYERSAIDRWIREHGTDPLQRSNSLRLEDLAPNLAVRQMVEEFARERNGGSLPPQIPREPAPAPAPAPAPRRRAPSSAARDSAPAPAPAPPPAPAREANPPLSRPFADEDDPLETGQIRVLGLWRKPDDPNPPDGRFFRFDAARVGAMIRRRFGPAVSDASASDSDSDSASAWITRGRPAGRAGTHVKDGNGAVLRCVNARTGKTSGVLLWDVGAADSSGAGVGCWNPSDYAAADDFRVGDVLGFPDLAGPALDAAPVQRVLFNTGTGWNLAGTHLAFGRCGVVGDWWRTLEAEFRMDEETVVAGVYTDAPSELPMVVYHLAEGEGERWVEARTRATEGQGRAVVIEPAVKTRAVRVAWETTDLHKTGGLSSARSGGGVHAHILATTTERPGGGVTAAAAAGAAAAARAARAEPPPAPPIVRTAPAPAPTADAEPDWWSPRAPVGEETRAPGQPQNNLPHV